MRWIVVVGGDGRCQAIDRGAIVGAHGGRHAFGKGDGAHTFEMLALLPDDGIGGDAGCLRELVIEALFEGADDETRDEIGAAGREQQRQHGVGRDDAPAHVARRIEDGPQQPASERSRHLREVSGS